MQSTPTGAPRSESWFRFHALTAQDRSAMVPLRTIAEPNKGKLRGITARAPRRTLISAAARAVGSTLTAIPARSQYTPAERMRLFLKAEGEPK
jgi:hypothetical protein